jgi:hypothetical protein
MDVRYISGNNTENEDNIFLRNVWPHKPVTLWNCPEEHNREPHRCEYLKTQNVINGFTVIIIKNPYIT